MNIFCFGETDMFAIADAVGARSLNAMDVLGGRWTREQATLAFADLCRRAAEHGLLVQLEFLSWSRIPDLEAAWQIVRDADQPNGGVTIDSWHYFRSGSDEGSLEAIPGSSVAGVQLSDAAARSGGRPSRRHPSRTALARGWRAPLRALVETLRRIGSQAPIGIEVFSDGLHERPAAEIGELAGEHLRSVLS